MQSLSRTGDVINKVDNISKYIYSKEQLIKVIEQYEIDAANVKKQLGINKEKIKMNKFEKIHIEELKNLRKLRDMKIDNNKLRLTVINGIDCDFVEF